MTATDRSERIAGLLAFERYVMTTAAERIARAPALRAKMFLCRWVRHAAGRVSELRRALPVEMAARATESYPDADARRLVDALAAIPDTGEFLLSLGAGTARVLATSYAAINTTATTDRSARALRRVEDCCRAAARAAGEVAGQSRSADGRRRLRSITRAAERLVLGAGDAMPPDALARSSAALVAPARERAIRALRHGEVSEDVWLVTSPHDYERYLHQLIAFEINTFEAVSRHIAEFAWMPWEFHWDMARQIGDELAHLEMWLERLEHAGGTLGRYPLGAHEFAVCVGHDLPGRVALLERLIESSALDALGLGRCMWDSRADAVMVGYLDRVQCDEIGHVRQGNKWLRRICGDDRALAALVATSEASARERMLGAARELEAAGVVPSGNAERVRRKFDDPLMLEVNVTAWERAGFSAEEIARERGRRRRTREEGVLQ